MGFRQPLHQRAAEFLEEYAAGPDVLYLAWPTVMSYLRSSTHPAIFANPLQPAEAVRNAETLLRLPHVRTLAEEDGFWDLYREVTKKTPSHGNDIPDAHLATLVAGDAGAFRTSSTRAVAHAKDPGVGVAGGCRLRPGDVIEVALTRERVIELELTAPPSQPGSRSTAPRNTSG